MSICLCLWSCSNGVKELQRTHRRVTHLVLWFLYTSHHDAQCLLLWTISHSVRAIAEIAISFGLRVFLFVVSWLLLTTRRFVRDIALCLAVVPPIFALAAFLVFGLGI